MIVDGKKRWLKRADYEKFASFQNLTSFNIRRQWWIISLVKKNLATILTGSFRPEDMRIAIEILVFDCRTPKDLTAFPPDKVPVKTGQGFGAEV